MSYRGIILDVDGTVVRGSTPLPGAAEGLAAIRDAGLRRVFVSNNPTKVPGAYERRFEKAGFEVSAEEVVTAGTVTTAYLASEHAADRLFVIGAPGLREQFRAAGLALTDDPLEADALVASLDREFDYGDMCDALDALADESVAFVGTDPDVVIPATDRNVPGSGAIIRAVSAVASREPDAICGKPSELTLDAALGRLDLPANDCLVVGDRLDTDVQLGANANMTTVLVRTGVTDERALANSTVEPDYVLDSLAELDRVLEVR